MLNGKCSIMFTDHMDFLADEDGSCLVFRNEAEARQYAEKEGLTDYQIIGLLNGYPDLSQGGLT